MIFIFGEAQYRLLGLGMFVIALRSVAIHGVVAMGQTARRLTPGVSVHHRFGAELRRWRVQRGLSQDALGRLVHTSGDLIGKIEKAERWPAQDLVERCDRVLATNDTLTGLLPMLDAERYRDRRRDRKADTGPASKALDGLFASALPQVTPTTETDRRTIGLPAGNLFAATAVDAWLAPMLRQTDEGVTAKPAVLNSPRPGDLLVAQDQRAEQPCFYATDARRLNFRSGDEIVIPSAYLIDDFTLGILWATRALDDALHDDDRPLADVVDKLQQSTPGRRAADPITGDLTETSQGWLGSYACARFIGTHLDASSGPPSFWTREQRGEEAATWLLFSHKLDYLRALRDRYFDRNTPMSRVFCLPEPAGGSGAERVLLLLAAALMEAMGVAVHVCGDHEYTTLEGFVLTSTGVVIVANWLRADQVWHGDVIGGPPAARVYQDALSFGRRHSIIAAPTPTGRLRRLADYMQVDWPWLITRAMQMSSVGIDGFVRPRSRFLSSAGIQTACEFLARQGGATDRTIRLFA